MVSALDWYYGDIVKYGCLSKHLSQRKLQYGGWKNLKVTNLLLQKTMTSSYQMELKKFIEASCIYNIQIGGKVF